MYSTVTLFVDGIRYGTFKDYDKAISTASFLYREGHAVVIAAHTLGGLTQTFLFQP